MAKLLKLRRGTTSQHSSFTGAEGEVTVDTDKEALVVHNGSTAGGFPVARADGTGVTNFTITGELDAATGDFSGDVDVDGTLEADAITVNGTALSTVIAGTTVTNATNAAGLTGTPNVTVGVVTAGSLDISGDADIDGTLEADAYTVNGTALDTHIAGVTVTNATNATNTTTFTTTANNSTDETVYPVFVDGATGAQGAETDTGLTYNPSTGLLTTAAVTTTGNVIVGGDLWVSGATTTVNSTTLTVDDKNIELGSVSSPSDTTADGGGITLKGASDKTFNWVNSTDAWTSSEHIHIPDSKHLILGTGSDFKVYHDGSNSWVREMGSGSLIIDTDGTDIKLTQGGAGENMARFIKDGAVELYHDNFKTFETQSNGIQITGPEGDAAHLYMYADDGDDNADKWAVLATAGGTFQIRNYSTGSWVDGLTLDGSNDATIGGRLNVSHDITITGTAPRVIFTDSNNNSDYRINLDGGNFQIQDTTNSNTTRWFINSSGNLLPGADSSYNIGAASERVTTVYADSFNDPKGDLRKIVQNTQGSAYTLVAADAGKHILASGTVTIPNSVFAAGDAVTIINNTSGDLTLTASVGTLYNTADAATGNRTLATRGMATILFTSATAAYISGAGLS